MTLGHFTSAINNSREKTMSGKRFKKAKAEIFKSFVFKPFLFAAFFVVLSSVSVGFARGSFGIYFDGANGNISVSENENTNVSANTNINANANANISANVKENANANTNINANASGNSNESETAINADENENPSGLTRGRVRLLTREVYFLERTELKFETYGGEKVDSVEYAYGGECATSMAAADPEKMGRIFVLIYWGGGFSGGSDEVEIEVLTDYKLQKGEDIYRNRFKLKLIFYDAVFPFDGGTYYIGNGSAAVYPSLRAETPDMTRGRFGATVRGAIGGVRAVSTRILKITDDKDGKPVSKTISSKTDLTAAVFPDGISGNAVGFFDALSAFFGEDFPTYREIDIEVEYLLSAEYSGDKYNEHILKTLRFTLRRIENNPETTAPMVSAVSGYVESTEGAAIDAQGLKAALNLDETFLNSFDSVVLRCAVFHKNNGIAELRADLKNGTGEAYTLNRAGKYTLFFWLDLDGKTFLEFEAEKNVAGEHDAEGLDIGGGIGGAVKIVTIVMGAAVFCFASLAAVAAVYKRKTELRLAERRAGKGADLNAEDGFGVENEDVRKGAIRRNSGENEDVRGDTARQRNGENEGVRKGAIRRNSGENEGVRGDTVRQRNGENEDVRGAVGIENGNEKRGFSYETLKKENKKISFGERSADERGDTENGGYDYIYDDEPKYTDGKDGGYLYDGKEGNGEKGGFLYGNEAENGSGVEKRGFSYETLKKERKIIRLTDNEYRDTVSDEYTAFINGNALKKKLEENSENKKDTISENPEK
ncbi:MAG: hypothetical protein LBP62_06575 [Clostridiales bacterium]|jgi:hypothetical protein|nr:hypothetical protein [Clostridiales bacterium]